MWADCGHVEAVTKVAGGVSGFDYAPKADAVFYAVDAEVTDADDFLDLRKKYDKVEYGHGKRKVSQVVRVQPDLDGGVRLIAERRYVRELAVTADGKRIAMISASDDTVTRSEGDSRVDVWDAETKAVTTTDQSWKKLQRRRGRGSNRWRGTRAARAWRTVPSSTATRRNSSSARRRLAVGCRHACQEWKKPKFVGMGLHYGGAILANLRT